MIDWICFYWLKVWMFIIICCTKAMCPAANRLCSQDRFSNQLDTIFNSRYSNLPRSPHIAGHPMLGKVSVMIKDRKTKDTEGNK